MITLAHDDESTFPSVVGMLTVREGGKPVICPVSLNDVQCGPECIVDEMCGESGVFSIVQLDYPQAILRCKQQSFVHIGGEPEKRVR